MITEIRSGQVFCLRNWAACINSLRIKVTASYSSGEEKSAEIDLPGRNGVLDGLIIVIMPDNGNTGVLFIGADMGSSVKTFILELENAGSPVRSLGLECAGADAAEVFSRSASVSYSPLLCSTLRFTDNGAGFSVDAVSSPDDADNAQEDSSAEVTTEDIIGDIDADIDMLSWYKTGSDARQAIAELRALKDRAETMPADVLAQEVSRYEEVLLDCIRRTRSDIRLYRDSLIEDSMRK